MRSSDDLIRDYTAARVERDRLRRERGACFCERAEPVSPVDYADAQAESQADPLATFEFPQPTQEEACWKQARKWEDNDRGNSALFYFDPPLSEWCETCRRRQALTEQYREAVKRHGGALRGLLRRGSRLSVEAGEASKQDTSNSVSERKAEIE